MSRRLGPIAVLAATAALSACSTAQRIGSIMPFGHHDNNQHAEPQDGRVSILTFEQTLAPDPNLAGHTVVVPPVAPINDWQQPGGTADNSPVHLAGQATLDVAWRANLGAGSSRRSHLAAPPVISEGKLFFLDADQRVHALDAASGRQIWSEELRPHDSKDHRARGGGLAAAAGRVFVTTGFGFAVALDASNGHEVWRAQVGAPFDAAPTVVGSRVYAVTNDSELISFDAATGEQSWSYQAIAEPARILAASSPAVDGDTVIAPFASGELIAFLSANGRRLWQDSLSRTGRLTSLSSINDIAGRPAIEDGVVYAASHSGVLTAIDVRTGTRLWARAFASTQTPWIAGDVLYAVSVDGELAAFDKATGGVYWVRQLRRYEKEEDHKGRVAWAGPIMVGGKLILANSLGEVVAVAPETGETGAHIDLHKPIFIPPIAADNQIYLVTDEARLVVLH
ncbi:MAG TPA: PQQ-binding-like beta-propeller repeat protein [Caulobacterales bacterium]|nr:PQQ-binding-like beta-propeller repeat protein [Caulobacterales bacterium]